MTRFWQVVIGNEVLRTAGAIANAANNTTKTNWTPTITARFDNAASTAFDFGLSGMLGRQSLFSPCAQPGGYGYQCNGASPTGLYKYVEADVTYTHDKTQVNAQVDYGELQKGAWNGGTARWYGMSLLGHTKWTTSWVGRMGATLRFDYLNNTSNGGGGTNIQYGRGRQPVGERVERFRHRSGLLPGFVDERHRVQGRAALCDHGRPVVLSDAADHREARIPPRRGEPSGVPEEQRHVRAQQRPRDAVHLFVLTRCTMYHAPGRAPGAFNPGDLTLKLHTFVTDTTDPRERGRLIGERFAPAIRETVALYLAFFPKLGIAPQRAREIGEASLATLGAWCPRLAAEVEAIADGVNLPCWQLACLNARTEILATAPALAEGECSTTVHAPAGPHAPRTLQTWDWHDSLAPQGLLMQIATPHGRTVKLFSEFGMLAKLGVNSAAGLHFNILHHASDNDSAGVPVHAIARRLLEDATTVQEAIDIARTARVSASTVLTVFTRHDANPRAASIELAVGRGRGGAASGRLAAAYEPLSRSRVERRRVMPDSSTTRERFAHLNDVVNGMTSADVRERGGDVRAAGAVVCFHPDLSMPDTERWETLLTVGIDTDACALDYVAGNPHDLARDGSAVLT